MSSSSCDRSVADIGDTSNLIRLMSSLLGDSFFIMSLFTLSVYFVCCLPLLLIQKIFPLNICFLHVNYIKFCCYPTVVDCEEYPSDASVVEFGPLPWRHPGNCLALGADHFTGEHAGLATMVEELRQSIFL